MAANMRPLEISDFINDPQEGVHAPPTFYTEVFAEIEDRVWHVQQMREDMLQCGFKPCPVSITDIW